MNPSPMPWDSRHVVRLNILTIIGLSLVVVGWYGAAGKAEVSAQFGWVNLAAFGVIVAGTGNVLWLLQGHRAVRVRQRAVMERVAATLTSPDVVADEQGASLVAVAGGTRAHLPGCPLVRDKRTRTVRGSALPLCEACHS